MTTDTSPKFGFVIDNRRCIGCHACTIACKAEHEVPIGVNRTWVKYIESGQFPNSQRNFHVMRCNHCDDAPCVNICPTKALFTRSNGIVDFDTSHCIACKACIQACPYDALYIDPETTTAQKCNFCAHRVEQSLLPSCVVVCPVTAIVAGDMNNPDTKISQILRQEKVDVRKPEKGTSPNVYYVNGKAEALQPSAAPVKDDYLWSAQSSGVGYRANEEYQSSDEAFDVIEHVSKILQKPVQVVDDAKRVYDAPSKGVLWGRKVSAYIITKAFAAGIGGAASLFALFEIGIGDDSSTWSIAWAHFNALLFLGVTSGLLVWDLGRPERFLMLLQRGNLKSWLVRGAYVLMAFGAINGVLWANAIVSILPGGLVQFLNFMNVFIAGLTAAYTGFLFAQAKGRDLWQNPRLILHFTIHAPLCGLLYCIVFGIVPAFVIPALFLTVCTSLFLLVLDAVTPAGTVDEAAAHELMRSGDQALIHWLGVWGAGHVLPLLLLAIGGPGWLIGLSMLVGMALHADQIVTQPQRIALS